MCKAAIGAKTLTSLPLRAQALPSQLSGDQGLGNSFNSMTSHESLGSMRSSAMARALQQASAGLLPQQQVPALYRALTCRPACRRSCMWMPRRLTRKSFEPGHLPVPHYTPSTASGLPTTLAPHPLRSDPRSWAAQHPERSCARVPCPSR